MMSYKKFKKGGFEEASPAERKSLMTTMLMGSATFLLDLLRHEDEFEAIVHKPNSSTSTKFIIELKYEGGSIYILRKMIYGNLLLNSWAAEDPQNYGLLIGFDFENKAELNQIIGLLEEYWANHNILFSEHKNI
ncbi:MAG: hypothetical protein WBB45_19215 [Cyclobacteriaceae bacterium]